MRALAALVVALVFAAPCAAQTRVKEERARPERAQKPGEIAIGIGHGIGFLP